MVRSNSEVVMKFTRIYIYIYYYTCHFCSVMVHGLMAKNGSLANVWGNDQWSLNSSRCSSWVFHWNDMVDRLVACFFLRIDLLVFGITFSVCMAHWIAGPQDCVNCASSTLQLLRTKSSWMTLLGITRVLSLLMMERNGLTFHMRITCQWTGRSDAREGVSAWRFSGEHHQLAVRRGATSKTGSRSEWRWIRFCFSFKFWMWSFHFHFNLMARWIFRWGHHAPSSNGQP